MVGSNRIWCVPIMVLEYIANVSVEHSAWGFKSLTHRFDNSGKGVSFDDYNLIRNNCFSARGTDCHNREIHKIGFRTLR